MSGALAERVFVSKLNRVGFTDIDVAERFPFPLERAANYPLFTADLVDLMYQLIPVDRQSEVATSVIVKARMPG